MMNVRTSLPLLLSKMSELPEFVELTLTDANQPGNFGNRPLHVAATWNDPAAIELLVENGADVNAAGEDEMTPLHRAAAAGNFDAASTLLRLGARLDLKDRDGVTPLELAQSLNRRSVVTLLRRAK
ncbi:ankyrin repeat domain-containing protein [Accumulibacter sp.]|uniref:ankyrin repeat domain-containing protein n=1 Tax=Accumulibacter sp. TaxID=2053492 RepID=UPI00287ABA4F|nr:ankyrin repeat domain-containing protein [Accumulibacter sp.]MDS4055718.1 ankyrin repeat domain-containing protein [Accumulibacter sp.]